MSYNNQDLPEYYIPPDVINAPAKIFGLTLFQLFALVMATVIAIVFVINIPLPGMFFLQIVLGGLVWSAVAGFFLLPFPHLTSFEQVLNWIAFRRSPIPRQTRAKPLPAALVRPTTVVSTTSSAGTRATSKTATRHSSLVAASSSSDRSSSSGPGQTVVRAKPSANNGATSNPAKSK